MAEKCIECFSGVFTTVTCFTCHKSVCCYYCEKRHQQKNSNHLFRLPVPYVSQYEKNCIRHYKKYEKFCNTCCELACIDCLHQNHENHETWFIVDAAKEKRREVANETAKIDQTLKQIKNQIEIRERNHKEITKEVEALLDPLQNECLAAYLEELKQIRLSEIIHGELKTSLSALFSFPTFSEHHPVNFLSACEEYRKYVEHGIKFPRQPSDQYTPLGIVYQNAEDDVINKELPNIDLTRGMTNVEQFKPTHGPTGSTKSSRENNNEDKIIANLQKELELKVAEIRSTQSTLEQIRKNTRLLVKLCNNTQSNVIIDQPGIITGQQETNRHIESIHKDMEYVLSYVKHTSERSSSNQQRLENPQRKEVQRLVAELQKSQDRVAQLEDSKKEVQRLNAELQTLQTIATQLDERKKASSNLEREESTRSRKEIQRLEAGLQKWQNCAEQLEDRWEATCKEKESLNRQVKRIENEKEDLKNRLSQVAGAKLTAGNSGITDLGDKYRPTRIAEMYSELYDTEWTEAMDDILQLNKWSEESIVQHMFIVLQECFNACKKIACHQMTELCKHLFPDVETRDMEKYMDTHVTEVKQLKDARKGTASVVGKMLSKSLIDRQGIRNECMEYNDVNSLIIDEIMKTSYGTTCITVCWFMVVQDPEMCLDEHLKQGDRFNKDVYKEYTRSGKKVAYSVWPALYLHKDGPLLTKGVAQAFN